MSSIVIGRSSCHATYSRGGRITAETKSRRTRRLKLGIMSNVSPPPLAQGVFKLGHYRNQPSRASFFSFSDKLLGHAAPRRYSHAGGPRHGKHLNKSFFSKAEEPQGDGPMWSGRIQFAFETRGLVKVGGTIDGYPSKFLHGDGDGRHMLPSSRDTRAIGKRGWQTGRWS